MACLTPSHIYNRACILNASASSAFLTVPCGHCPECVDSKTLEYKYRAYNEWQDTLDKGGFAFMDTLTFNEESFSSKRRFHGMRSFRPEDITMLFKKLRSRCVDKYTFRYFLSAEYGGLYKRPHYHVIFYVIPVDKHYLLERAVYEFRRFVKESWTEPVLNSKGKQLFTTNKFGYHKPVMRSLGNLDKVSSLMSRVIDRVDGMCYVAKYVVKCDDFVQEIKAKFDYLVENTVHDSESYEALEHEYRRAMPFHRQSKGFGASVLPYLESIKIDLANDPCVVNLKINKDKIPLPMYFIRKLFYKTEKIINYDTGEVFQTKTGKDQFRWVPTPLGEAFELYQKTKQIDRYVKKYYDAQMNFFIYLEDGKQKYKDVWRLLDGRPLKDFIIYKLIYKDHLHNNFAFGTDTKRWDLFFKASRQQGITDNYAYSDDKHEKEEFRKYLVQNMINDSINPIWKDFDQIDHIFDEYFKAKSEFVLFQRKYISDVKLKLKLLHSL